MHIQITAFTICHLFITSLAVPQKDEEKLNSSTGDVAQKNVYIDLKELFNNVVSKLEEDYEIISPIKNKFLIIYIAILDENSLENLVRQCKELGNDLDFNKFMDKLMHYITNDIHITIDQNRDIFLKSMFKFYSNGAESIPVSIVLDMLNCEKIKLDKEVSNEIIVSTRSNHDQLDYQNFSEIMNPQLEAYFEFFLYNVEL
ncbi:uncharacterized protein LOC126894161 isoform X2 [Daktulosphaira vitifoliae]|uniref:uncharacterized protein LOC126894161 isoform X2 n=1 Tax=Daktulosphaira vitifoliae TaxID=58002 RepID=UPI0021A9A9C1|nr:uncharacterized protein LOC126894161 isoform X2 [Daktulosphaira vitifoliae]